MQTHYEPARLAPLLSINESARLLGVSRATVYRLIREGDLTPTRVGARARLEPHVLYDYIARHREGTLA